MNGSFDALISQLKRLKLICKNENCEFIWNGGSRKLILIGDILCDRTPEGIEIIQLLLRLKDQAELSNGNIIFILGNHEDILISFLLERQVAKALETKDSLEALLVAACLVKSNDQKQTFLWQGKGILEFIHKWSAIGRKSRDLVELQNKIEQMILNGDFIELSLLPSEIRLNMRNSISGRILLDALTEMKLVYRDGDTLIFHTEPTKEMLSLLDEGENLDEKIMLINSEYKACLKALLFEEGILKKNNNFNFFSRIFLHPDNRSFVDSFIRDEQIAVLMHKLRCKGIKNILHGHTTVSKFQEAFVSTGIINLINVDFGVGRPGIPNKEDKLSAAILPVMNENIIVGKECENILPFNPDEQRLIDYIEDWLEYCIPEAGVNDKLARELYYLLNIKDFEYLVKFLNNELRNYLTEVFNARDSDGNLINQGNASNLVNIIRLYYSF